ncbi:MULTISPECIES: hypothetical protein [unclassified Leeuwenhoekiella]|uniref:hypothetical protein n=1 Tax=unclassified Leeuwenhoekiella TaxID=2615029 RepID=UPI000C4041EA|nr:MULTISPECIES: hypothetical protein [unclassified Leeuwenhoekiella]MAW93685.1 hypothetical protein [Leeuwenhoekiella sp.]MBA83091.1 hypothetical protein [Leeuwenhoekiella sp.]|tara:strand:- start:5825 stop:6340 length:516 start_codon:yes stop_codon:yes gene_type:complete
MLESLIFILIVISVGISLILAIVFLLLGLAKKSKRLRKIALECALIATFFFSLIPLWYSLIVPWFNANKMKDFSGEYVLENSNKSTETVTLFLYENGTYSYDGSDKLGLHKTGNWRTGGVDGTFEFLSENDNLLKYARPNSYEEKCEISFDIFNRDRFQKINKLVFIKKVE